MGRAGAIDDLFGHVPQRGELPIPDAAASPEGPEVHWTQRLVGGLRPVPPGGHTTETVREMAHYVLGLARAAETMPWNAEMVRRYTAGFIRWTEWLKNGEGDALIAEFKAEMDRLKAPADQVSPDWREKYGLD